MEATANTDGNVISDKTKQAAADEALFYRRCLNALAAPGKCFECSEQLVKTVLCPKCNAGFSGVTVDDWQLVSDAVNDAVNNGEGQITAHYLEHSFKEHKLRVIQVPE